MRMLFRGAILATMLQCVGATNAWGQIESEDSGDKEPAPVPEGSDGTAGGGNEATTASSDPDSGDADDSESERVATPETEGATEGSLSVREERTGEPTESAAGEHAAEESALAAPKNDADPGEDEPADEGDKSEKEKEKEKKKSYKPKLYGYIQFYFKTRVDREDNGVEPNVFRFGRVKVAVKGKIMPKLRYVVEVDPRSPQLAGVIRDAYLEWEPIKNQEIRAGQMKTPFGWENRESSANLYTVNRTEVGEHFGRGVTLRDLGVGLFGHVNLGNGFRIEDEISVTNGAGLNVQEEHDARKNIFGRLGARWKTDAATIGLGVSGATGNMYEPAIIGPPPEPDVFIEFQRAGADLSIDTKYFFAVGEYAMSHEKSTDDELTGNHSGWYALAAGKTPWDVGPMVRYDVAEIDAKFERWTFGAYYGEPEAAFRLMATYEIFSEDEERHDDRLLLWSLVRF